MSTLPWRDRHPSQCKPLASACKHHHTCGVRPRILCPKWQSQAASDSSDSTYERCTPHQEHHQCIYEEDGDDNSMTEARAASGLATGRPSWPLGSGAFSFTSLASSNGHRHRPGLHRLRPRSHLMRRGTHSLAVRDDGACSQWQRCHVAQICFVTRSSRGRLYSLLAAQKYFFKLLRAFFRPCPPRHSPLLAAIITHRPYFAIAHCAHRPLSSLVSHSRPLIESKTMFILRTQHIHGKTHT